LDLSADLQRSRERIVIGREEERRRLRRDLHDGLGPALTGIAMTADAAANLFHGRPDQVQTLLGSLRRDTRMMITDVRRLVDDLRPPALDELGLLGAIRKRADQLAWRADGSALVIRLDIPDTLPTLPAAIEVAAYRIATEALTNVARHADASAACVQLRCATSLDLEVTDDGGGDDGWLPGVGLHGMRERATEVGGRFEAGPNRTGGRVFVTIPLGTS
jgi:two-component system NarL family sensor kinase